MRLKEKASLLILLMLFSVSLAKAAEYSVTIENLTDGLYFKNLIIAAHNDNVDLFEPAARVSERLEWLVECGEPKYYFELNQSAENRGEGVPDPETMVFNVFDPDEDPENDEDFWNVAALDPRDISALQLIGPGEISAAVYLDAVKNENNLLTVFGRVMATNDGFVGLDGALLPTSSGAEKIYELYLWDAGSEINNEILVSPNQCEVDCTAEAASLWGCTGVEDCQESYVGLADCNHQECPVGPNNEAALECYAQVCSAEMTAYSACYDREYEGCDADEDKEIPEYTSMTACINAKCESELSGVEGQSFGLEGCLDEAEESCAGVWLDFLKCSSENCLPHYADVTGCMATDKILETPECSENETGDGCCADDNQAYWECLKIDLQCQDDIEDNACDLENIYMPDLPGLAHIPMRSATGVVLFESNPLAMVHIHRGIMGDQDPDGGKSDLDSSLHRWEGPVARVVVKVN